MLSMGVCASSGGMFNNYAIVQGVDQVVPVDMYAPGCPPGPRTLLHAILALHEKIRTGELTQRRSERGSGAAVDLAAHGVPQSGPAAHGVPQSGSAAHGVPQSGSAAHGVPQSNPAAHGVPQSSPAATG